MVSLASAFLPGTFLGGEIYSYADFSVVFRPIFFWVGGTSIGESQSLMIKNIVTKNRFGVQYF